MAKKKTKKPGNKPFDKKSGKTDKKAAFVEDMKKRRKKKSK